MFFADLNNRCGSTTWFAAVFTLLIYLLASNSAQATDYSVLNGMRAIHMGGNWGANREYDQFLDENNRQAYVDWLKSNHINWVGISVALFVNNSMDSQVKRKYPPVDMFILTFFDEELAAMVETLHANGIKVFLTLAFENHGVNEVDDPVKQVNRGMFGIPNAWQWEEYPPQEYWPWDTAHPDHQTFVSEFWQSYTEQAVHFATLAESLGVEMFSLGTETDGLFRTRADNNYSNHFKDEIRAMVSAVRSVYSGLLTYDQLIFVLPGQDYSNDGRRWLWQDSGLDVIGISAYYQLVDQMPTARVPYTDLKAAWEGIFTNNLLPMQADNPDMPIVFTEFGATDSIVSPYISFYDSFANYVFTDGDASGVDDGRETQADLYSSFFATNNEHEGLIKGAFGWEHYWTDDNLWETFVGWARHFAIRNKPAEEVVRAEYAAIASNFASLTGTVVDAADGVTPVHPVAIDLADAATGEWLNVSRINHPDGSYEIPDIPIGDYKVFFNAIGDANAYADELYQKVSCDNGECDISTMGNIVSLTGGSNLVNVQLDRQISLSGQVTGISVGPLPNVSVEVLDQAGSPVGAAALTAGDGSWVKGVPNSGTYFVRTLRQPTSVYRPEVWNDIPCDGCNVVEAGTPIIVSSDDVTGINIELWKEIIFLNGLE